MEFKTKRLILRPWRDTDAGELYKYAKDPDVGPMAGWPVHTCIENSRDIIKNILSEKETYAVCLKEDNLAIGSVGLIPPRQSHTDAAQNEIEIGYWIGKAFWGHGLIPEAVKKLQEHAFVDLNCSAMWCGYYDGNEKSKRCQEKCGFIYNHTEMDKQCPLMGDIRTEHFTKITKEQWENCFMQGNKNRKVILFIHGKDGSASEAEHYKPFFQNCDIVGLDYKSNTPWETKVGIRDKVKILEESYDNIILIAHSIGAFYAMNALNEQKISKSYFISPIVNMEKLIRDMMLWSNVTEKELQEKQKIETKFGETLSWEYLCYVRKNEIKWDVPTNILYGNLDNLTSRDTIDSFVEKTNSKLTVMEDGEHWFHTDSQMEFLDKWILKSIN